MTKISQLQKQFADHIYDDKNCNILSYLPYDDEESLARLNIYRNNVLGNYAGVLESIYSRTKDILGNEIFGKISREFYHKFKSKTGNLDEYGAEFPDFLNSVKSQHNIDFLTDLARLELYYHLCYFADDVIVLTVKTITKLPESKYEGLIFDLHPSCFLLKSDFDIFAIWHKKKPKKNHKNYLLIMRPFFQEEIVNLDEEEFLFLDEIKQKRKLYAIYQKIVNKNKKDFDIGACLNKFISLGAISNFKS